MSKQNNIRKDESVASLPFSTSPFLYKFSFVFKTVAKRVGIEPIKFLGVGKNFRLLMQSCRFFRPTFHENFNFLKNCLYDFHKILHSHSTLKGAPACAKASKSYHWNVRNIAKISPKMAKVSPKTAIFRLFLIFSKTVDTIRTKFSRVILHHTRVLYVQWHQNRIAGM